MSSTSQASAGSTPLHADPPRSHTNSFLIGREKPGTQSEVARLISETLEQEKSQQEQQHRDDPYEQSTEEVSHLGGLTQPWPLALWLAQSSHTPAGKVAVNKHGVLSPWGGGMVWLLEPAGIVQCLLFKSTSNHKPLFTEELSTER